MNMKKELSDKINKYVNKNYNNYVFVISGRAAIDLALKEALISNPKLKVYVPDYLCDSMVRPLIDQNIPINYYSIDYNGLDFDIKSFPFDKNEDIILLYCDYFINNSKLYNKISNYLSLKSILIHDVTHTLFSKNYLDYRDDYMVCSMRKWFNTIDGGLCISKEKFKNTLLNDNKRYLLLKENARKKKKKYYDNPTEFNRQNYLHESEMADIALDNGYSLCKMSQNSFESIINIDFDSFFGNKRIMYDTLKELLDDYEIIHGNNRDNCIFTLPLVNVENRNEVYDNFKQLLIRCSIMWEYGNNEIQKRFVDNSICLDISVNSIKKLRRY